MKTALLFGAFFMLSCIWPYWIGGRTRGNVTAMCVVAPWIAFAAGWFVK